MLNQNITARGPSSDSTRISSCHGEAGFMHDRVHAFEPMAAHAGNCAARSQTAVADIGVQDHAGEGDGAGS